jgi:hypothetical protein
VLTALSIALDNFLLLKARLNALISASLDATLERKVTSSANLKLLS